MTTRAEMNCSKWQRMNLQHRMYHVDDLAPYTTTDIDVYYVLHVIKL